MPAGRKISMVDGRLVISTAASTGFIATLGILFGIGVFIWANWTYLNQEIAKPGAHLEPIGFVAVMLLVPLLWILQRRKLLPKEARAAVQGQVFILDRQKDLFLRNDDMLAPLSSVKKILPDSAKLQYGFLSF